MAEENNQDIHGGIDNLTLKEMKFLRCHTIEGMTLHEAYKAVTPDTKMRPDNMRRAGWEIMNNIRKKLPSWKEVFMMFDTGPPALVKVFKDAIKAESYQDVYQEKKKTVKGKKEIVTERATIVTADHRTRVAAARELKEIFALAEQTINIKAKEPLPLVVITTDGEIEEE